MAFFFLHLLNVHVLEICGGIASKRKESKFGWHFSSMVFKYGSRLICWKSAFVKTRSFFSLFVCCVCVRPSYVECRLLFVRASSIVFTDAPYFISSLSLRICSLCVVCVAVDQMKEIFRRKKKQEVLETWMRSGPFGRAERVYECASECVYVFCSVNIEQEIIGYRHLQLTFMCTSYNDTLSDARTNAHGMRPNFGWVLSVCCSSSSRLYHR